MRKVLLSADSEISLYLVPDEVADNLSEYCIDFCSKWLVNSPDACKYRRKYRGKEIICFNEADFIDYLNEYVFPEQKSVFIKKLGYQIPTEYKYDPYFNF